MISCINKALINIVQYIPVPFIRLFSNRYIAGIDMNNALKVVKDINDNNLSATIDILGEHTQTIEEANSITREYVELLKNIRIKQLDCNISIKPTHIGSDINLECYKINLKKIHSQATINNNFVRIDMENTQMTDLTIKSYFEQYNCTKNIGLVIQAYLYRSMDDLKKLNSDMNIRLCKGIYNEKKDVAIKDPSKINDNYIALLIQAFDRGLYVGIATHDINLIKKIIQIIQTKKINKNKFEFQVLYGVPMGNMIKKLLSENFKVRVYIPYGEDWYNYSIRRIKENPNIAGYIIKNIFKRNFYK